MTVDSGRIEDHRFLTGEARFLDDLPLDGALHGVVLRAPHAEAQIAALDAGAARAMPGVHLVLTANELAAELGRTGVVTLPLDLPPPDHALADFRDREQPVLARDRVRHVGEPVAFVVADTPALAQDAAEAIEVDYAYAPPRPPLADDRAEVMFRFERGDSAATDRAFAAAARVEAFDLPVNRVHAMPLEPRGAIGAHDADTDSFTLHVGTQRVHLIQRALADRVLGVARDRMRVIAPDTGGGFGQKNGLYPEHVLCLVAARMLGRPVKWIATRSEGMAADCHGRANHFRIQAALDSTGDVTALRVRRRIDLGAWLAPRAMVTAENGLTHLTGVYGIASAHVTVEGVATSTAPTCPYRGAGRPENVFACERMIDTLARRLGRDPLAFRRSQLVPARAMPWRTPLGTVLDGFDIAAVLEGALARIDAGTLAARHTTQAPDGRLQGLGVALFVEDLHGSGEPAPARIALLNGKLRLSVATGSTGHGHETTFVRLVAARLGLRANRVAFVQSDTGVIPDGIGTAASWSVTLGGSSVALAADAAVARGCRVAARLLDAGEVTFDDGVFRARNRSCDWDQVLAADPGFAVDGVFTGNGGTVSIGAHACAVRVDAETGAVTLDRAAVVQDCGRALDPALVAGQLHGGFAQGAGQGWMEQVGYDLQSGQLLTGGLSDYAVPRAADLPPIATALVANGAAGNPLGVKGIGESAATGATAAFVNAVVDALAPLGVHDIAPPLTPCAVRSAIAAAAGGR